MPRCNSPSFENCFCSNAPQPLAARFVMKFAGWSPMFILVAELIIIKRYSLHLLRLIYICPAVSIVAGVITVVAYWKRISLGYIIALAVNGISSVGWIISSGWLIISWSTAGYFAVLDASDFVSLMSHLQIFVALSLTFEGVLYSAYVDSKHESQSSNVFDHSPVPETSMNPDSAESEP